MSVLHLDLQDSDTVADPASIALGHAVVLQESASLIFWRSHVEFNIKAMYQHMCWMLETQAGCRASHHARQAADINPALHLALAQSLAVQKFLMQNHVFAH